MVSNIPHITLFVVNRDSSAYASRKSALSKLSRRTSPEFTEFTITLDNIFKGLRSSEIGADSSDTEAISREEESLWSSGVVNVDSAQGLLRAVFYYNGKCFCLRGGQEHRVLRLSQLKRANSSKKNRKGGVAQMRLDHKTVSSFADPEAGNRCHVHLLDLYIRKLPIEAVEKDIFYCRPPPSLPSDPYKPWFSAVPVGRNHFQRWYLVCVRKQV